MTRTIFYHLLSTYLDGGDIPWEEAHLIVEIWESNRLCDSSFDFWSAISALDAIRWDND